MSILEIENEIIEEFSLFDNKQDQYQYIIELGKALAPFPEEARKEGNLIKGCQSQVWLTSSFSDEGKVIFLGDSDSTLVKGLASLMIRVLSERTPKEIISADLAFIEKIGLKAMLSMNRSNGLSSMIKQMKLYAIAFQSAS